MSGNMSKPAIVLLLLGTQVVLSLATCTELDESQCPEKRCFIRKKDADGCRICECNLEADQIIMSDIKTDKDNFKIANIDFGTDYGKELQSNEENVQRGASKVGTIRLWNTYISGDKYLIPYTIEPSIPSSMQTLIDQAIQDFETMTCFTFDLRSNQENYIDFNNSDSGCWSYIGRRAPGSPNTIQLANTGCGNKGVVIHEILHALGFWHEQSRPDRDNYVRIHWDNISPGSESNFFKKTTDEIDSLGVAYDVRSIMHYFSDSFSSNDENTITDLNNNTLPTQQLGFVDSDLEQLHLLYGCTGTTITTTATTTTTTEPSTTSTTTSTTSSTTPTTTISTTSTSTTKDTSTTSTTTTDTTTTDGPTSTSTTNTSSTTTTTVIWIMNLLIIHPLNIV